MATMREAHELTRMLLETHGLQEWDLVFDNARNRAGQCQHGRLRISLSKHFVRLNTIERVRLTVLHEIAHALTLGHGHDRTWQQTCLRIGGDGRRCFDESDTTMAPSKFTGECPTCGATFRRHRKSPAMIERGLYCRTCARSGNIAAGRIIWSATILTKY